MNEKLTSILDDKYTSNQITQYHVLNDTGNPRPSPLASLHINASNASLWLLASFGSSQPPEVQAKRSVMTHCTHTPLYRHHSNTTSISTSETISNLTGPGRLLGTVFSRVGLSLERAIGRFTHRVGFGPRAIRKQIGKKMSGHSATIFPWNSRESTQSSLPYDGAIQRILRLCKELDAYTRYVA